MPPASVLGLIGLLTWLLVATAGCRSPAPSSATESGAPESLLIREALLVDGSGAPARLGDLRVVGGRIVAIGDLALTPGEASLDAAGRVLAPGFIDSHSHHDAGLRVEPSATAAVSQGITTVVVGQDGGSRFPLGDFFAELERKPAALNVASYSGHGTLRSEVLGDDFRRESTEDEIEQMIELLRTDLEAGALGLSTGLEYDPGIYSTTAEVVALAQVAARYEGRYISHIRSEDRDFWRAIDELLEIGRQAQLPVQISHVKLAMSSLHGRAEELLAKLDHARAEGIEVTADIYPYTYWQSTLEVMFPQRDFQDLEAARFAVEELSQPQGMIVATFLPEPDYAGKTLAEIAAMRGEQPARTLIELIALAHEKRRELAGEGEGSNRVESVIATSMSEQDIATLIAWPHANFCTDGVLRGRHPRGFGSFPRVLGHYAREHRKLSLEEAVHKLTGLTARHLGLRDRGLLREGLVADLVLFDPELILDLASTAEPQLTSLGIVKVWVGGVEVWSGEAATGQLPGRVLRRAPRVEADREGR